MRIKENTLGCPKLRCPTEICVKRLAADAKFASEGGSTQSTIRFVFLQKSFGLFVCERFLATLVDTFSLGDGDAFALPLAYQGTLKLSDCGQNAELELRHGGVLAGEGHFRFAGR